jgi:hypothetical protein
MLGKVVVHYLGRETGWQKQISRSVVAIAILYERIHARGRACVLCVKILDSDF